MPIFMKCKTCSVVKEEAEFIRPSGARRVTCNACAEYMKGYGKEWRAKNPERVRANNNALHQRKKAMVAPEGQKICPRCLVVKPVEYFGTGWRDEPNRCCPPCREYYMLWARSKRGKFTPEEKKKLRSYYQDRQQAEKRRCMEAYGNKCACCGDSHIEFMAIDHPNRDGAAHRREIKKAGLSFYIYLRELGYPKTYRILCFNCNWAHGIYGQCPHERERGIHPIDATLQQFEMAGTIH